MPLTSIIAALAFTAGPAPLHVVQTPAAADTVKLERTYKAGESVVYSLDASGGMVPKTHLLITEKVLKLIENGANIEMSAEDPDHASEGNGPGKLTLDFSKKGMPSELHIGGNESFYALFGVTGYIPGDSIAPGKDFTVSWTSAADKDFTIGGTGTFLGLEDKDGKKLAKIKTKLDVHPGANGDATVQNVAFFDTATGRLVSASGTVTLDAGDITYTVKLVKES